MQTQCCFGQLVGKQMFWLDKLGGVRCMCGLCSCCGRFLHSFNLSISVLDFQHYLFVFETTEERIPHFSGFAAQTFSKETFRLLSPLHLYQMPVHAQNQTVYDNVNNWSIRMNNSFNLAFWKNQIQPLCLCEFCCIVWQKTEVLQNFWFVLGRGVKFCPVQLHNCSQGRVRCGMFGQVNNSRNSLCGSHQPTKISGEYSSTTGRNPTQARWLRAGDLFLVRVAVAELTFIVCLSIFPVADNLTCALNPPGNLMSS